LGNPSWIVRLFGNHLESVSGETDSHAKPMRTARRRGPAMIAGWSACWSGAASPAAVVIAAVACSPTRRATPMTLPAQQQLRKAAWL